MDPLEEVPSTLQISFAKAGCGQSLHSNFEGHVLKFQFVLQIFTFLPQEGPSCFLHLIQCSLNRVKNLTRLNSHSLLQWVIGCFRFNFPYCLDHCKLEGSWRLKETDFEGRFVRCSDFPSLFPLPDNLVA